MTSTWTEHHVTTPDGVRLSCRDSGGDGTPVVLLHGLAGHAGEWEAAAARLSARHRVIAVDQRGHGASERRPADVSRGAYVADVVAVIAELGLDRPVLAGQSLGGHTAMLTAAAHPELVRGLVLVDAGPAAAGPDTPKEIAEALGSWPVPFPSLDAAREFLGSEAWAAGLEQRADGWYPRFDVDVMVAAITPVTLRPWWPEWEAIACPALVVLGQRGIVPAEESDRMLELAAHHPDTALVCVPDAGHDVHLDRPEVLHSLLSRFLTCVDGRSGAR
ncbi:alpha/beta hydrolase [Streptomyces sp. NBC_00249]|uniref:alpha/beta fold hydrolase n=1 Tax=Streptomyces sp. NBC_00249 TaxID=2975690 RepID=UPI0022576BC9|nr:alpha/beta hydrolase [Streptomyces sp. NBC_00249]MCX5199788.1 alpha/beta hydrolase [Streptomyces sp. NBC_00249]